MRNVITAGAALLCMHALAPPPARAQSIETMAFMDAGIYTGRHEGKQPSPKTASGSINIVSNRTLVDETDRICARVGVYFGVSYVLKGAPAGGNVTLDLVTRFPAPGVVNPKGQRFTQNEFTAVATIGEKMVRTFSFDDTWEMVPGTWTFEFHYQGRKLGEKVFQVMTTCETS
jgi:Domain of unknown function (DUF3859)